MVPDHIGEGTHRTQAGESLVKGKFDDKNTTDPSPATLVFCQSPSPNRRVSPFLNLHRDA